MKYFAIIISLVLASCGSKRDSIQPHSVMSYTAMNAKGETQEYYIWTYHRQVIDKESKFVNRKLAADDVVKLDDGTNLYFSGSQVIVNGNKHQLESINYILDNGKLEPGFIRTFE
jgi:hypothetical protein